MNIIREILKIAKEFVAIEFDNKKQMEEYKKNHKVRRNTKLEVKKNNGVSDKRENKDDSVRDKWFDNPFHKDRILYHGTSKKNWDRIQKSGGLEPMEADNKDDGKSVWFTTDIEYARSRAKNEGGGGVIIGIKHGDAASFKHHRYSPYPNEEIKAWKKEPDKWGGIDKIKERIHDFDFVVHERIPLKNVRVIKDE